MSQVDELLRAAEWRASSAAKPGVPAPPARRIAIVTCMDARIDVTTLFGLQPGDAHVLRNAGAAVTADVLRSLLVSQRELATREVMLIAHSGCGMSGLDATAFSQRVRDTSGAAVDFSLETFSDVDEHVREGLRRITGCRLLQHRDGVRGFVLDLASGRLREVAG